MIISALCYWLLTVAIAPFFLLLALITTAALFKRSSGREASTAPESGSGSPRFLVVIPAHDEEKNVADTVRSCLALHNDPKAFQVFVIADNCTDDTARVAREAGASVVERSDPDLRSKGHALEYFFDRIAETGDAGPYDAAVIIDADTVVDPDLLTRFASALNRGADWVQAYYTVRNPDASWRTQLLTFAFSLFNGVWLLGQDRLGISVGFRGNGMGFSARGMARVPWKAYGLVEDQEFSWMLRVAGERVRFLPETRVYGEMVSRGRAAVSQRRRWEDGRRSLRRRFFRPILASQALSLDHKLLSLVELYFPPLTKLGALLLLTLTIYPAALVFPRLTPAAWSLMAFHAVMVLTLTVYILSPFLCLNLPWRYLATLTRLPQYAAWKVFTMARVRSTSWVRTQREEAEPISMTVPSTGESGAEPRA